MNHVEAISEGTVPDRDKNPLIQAFLETSPRNQYSKVLEGIGRVAVAVAFAEFTVDMIGCSLTGKPEAFMALTKNMSLGPKIDRVMDMCRSLSVDNSLRDDVKSFCSRLQNMIKTRNDTVHSLYGVDLGEVIRITLRAVPKKRRSVVTPEELNKLSREITELASEGVSLEEAIEKQQGLPRDKHVASRCSAAESTHNLAAR